MICYFKLIQNMIFLEHKFPSVVRILDVVFNMRWTMKNYYIFHFYTYDINGTWSKFVKNNEIFCVILANSTKLSWSPCIPYDSHYGIDLFNTKSIFFCFERTVIEFTHVCFHFFTKEHLSFKILFCSENLKASSPSNFELNCQSFREKKSPNILKTSF